jgi:hypothetical protein
MQLGVDSAPRFFSGTMQEHHALPNSARTKCTLKTDSVFAQEARRSMVYVYSVSGFIISANLSCVTALLLLYFPQVSRSFQICEHAMSWFTGVLFAFCIAPLVVVVNGTETIQGK